MRVQVDVTIDAPRDAVWRLVSDIENAASTISGIEGVEILERPESGMLGLEWTETRTLFGKTATETMRITDVREGSYYVTEARSHGSVYRTRVALTELPDATRLSMEFQSEAETFGARVLSSAFGFLLRRATKKALLRDLEDVKGAAETAEPYPEARPDAEE